MAPSVVPDVLEGWMRPFRRRFTAAVWRHVLVLVCGALLAPGRRTVAAALRVMGPWARWPALPSTIAC
jgi:hypothetical protein